LARITLFDSENAVLHIHSQVLKEIVAPCVKMYLQMQRAQFFDGNIGNSLCILA
jgi:hypothetical protein